MQDRILQAGEYPASNMVKSQGTEYALCYIYNKPVQSLQFFYSNVIIVIQ